MYIQYTYSTYDQILACGRLCKLGGEHPNSTQKKTLIAPSEGQTQDLLGLRRQCLATVSPTYYS